MLYLCKPTKVIYDCIHGYIQLSLFAKYIIDTPIFQRLRKISQLSTCQYIYPNAHHTRFEHSIGTYHLAHQQLTTIKAIVDPTVMHKYLSEINELHVYLEDNKKNSLYNFDKYIRELIKIASLTHDLGHGPFSHMFDDVILLNNKHFIPHEHRSCILLQKIIKEHPILKDIIPDDHINFMKNIICPKKEHTTFLYQVVSNTITGIDVDKFDYLVRDSYSINIKISFDYIRLLNKISIVDGKICYPLQSINDIYELFRSRYRLHKTLYSHKGTISVQLMFHDIIINLTDLLNLDTILTDINKFALLTDEYIMNITDILLSLPIKISDEHKEKLLIAKSIKERIDNRNLYKFVCKITTTEHLDLTKLKEINIPQEMCIYQTQLGYVSGNKPNPLNNVKLYKKYDNNIKLYNLTDIPYLESDRYIEYVIMIFSKSKDIKIINNIKEIFIDFIKNNYNTYLDNII